MAARSERRLSAILAADVAGYCRHIDRDEEGTVIALRRHLDALVPIVTDHGGHVVDTAGDGLLAEFPSAVRATEAAIAIQRRMAELDAEVPAAQRLQFRIGINVGDILVDGDHIFGDGVNVAARLEQLAEPGSVLISGTAFDNLQGKLDLSLTFAGEQQVKNIARPIRTYRVGTAGPLTPARAALRHRRLPALGALAALTVGLAAILAVLPETKRLISAYLPRAIDTAQATPTIAILPFTDVGDEAASDVLAEGLTDDLITDLSKISGLLVIARNSAFTFKDQPVDVPSVSRQLGVRYILSGTVRRAGERMRINVQLTDASTERNLWAERYERDIATIFALQDEVIGHIVEALSVRLTETERGRITRLPTTSLEAYDYYTRAEQKVYATDYASLSEALTLYQKAIKLDPGFADAYAGYARASADVLGSDVQPLMLSAVARQRAYDAAGRALQINPQSARAYAVLGTLQMLDGEIDEAIASVEKAVALDPNGADAELNRAIVLTYAGRNAEALTSIERVLQLDPKPRPPVTDYHAFILYMNRRYADALGAMPPSEPEGRGDLGLEVAAMANARLGRDQAAHEAAAEMIRRSPALNLATLRVIYAHHRRAEDLDLRLEALALAGIPQWCYGFAPRQQGRLDAAALRSAVVDRSWVGREHSGAAFEMQFSGDGQFAQSAEGRAIITGSYVLSGDEICTRSEATLMGRAFCSALYRDPGAPGSFIYADSVGIWRFSVQPPIASATRPAPPVASP